MAVELPVLSSSLVAELLEMLREHKAAKGRLGLRGTPDVVADRTWHYVALAPVGGIPAIQSDYLGTGTGSHEGDVPGSAICLMHYKEDNFPSGAVRPKSLLRSLGTSERVFNASGITIAAGSYVICHRDQHGVFWAENATPATQLVEVVVPEITATGSCVGSTITITLNYDTTFVEVFA